MRQSVLIERVRQAGTDPRRLRFLIRGLLIGFIVGLALSGITAFPLPQEVALLARWMGIPEGPGPMLSGLSGWIAQVRDALQVTDKNYPFLFYGTDWLAFAHLVIALLFIGPYRDPVKNIWVIEWAMIACVLVWPLALICGPLRDIPFAWRLIDCSFGFVGLIPLILCRRLIKRLEIAERAA